MSPSPIPPIHLSDEQFARVNSILDKADPEALRRAAEELRMLALQIESERETVRLALSILLRAGMAIAAA